MQAPLNPFLDKAFVDEEVQRFFEIVAWLVLWHKCFGLPYPQEPLKFTAQWTTSCY